jgi:hypothetical protein
MFELHPVLGRRARLLLAGCGAGLSLLAASVAVPAFADQPSTSQSQTPDTIGPHTHQLHGQVTKTSGSSFELTTERFGPVNVTFAGRTPRGHGQGQGPAGHERRRAHELLALADLKVGDRVVVQGHTSADGKSFVARRVHVLPPRDAQQQAGVTHVLGTITNATTANGTTTLTLALADGSSRSVVVSSTTRIRPDGKTVADLKNGVRVTAIVKDGTASGIVVHPA